MLDSDYHEELGLLKPGGERGAYLKSEGITVASLGASMPCGNDEQITVTIIAR